MCHLYYWGGTEGNNNDTWETISLVGNGASGDIINKKQDCLFLPSSASSTPKIMVRYDDDDSHYNMQDAHSFASARCTLFLIHSFSFYHHRHHRRHHQYHGNSNASSTPKINIMTIPTSHPAARRFPSILPSMLYNMESDGMMSLDGMQSVVGWMGNECGVEVITSWTTMTRRSR